MTRKNYLSLLIAGAMGISCLGMNVSAESAFAVGDVDMDGTVTGHDTAMVSRYLHEDDYALTEEQLTLADVDADGEVTQADADKLYNEMQEYELGDVDWSVEGANISDSSKVLQYYHCAVEGVSFDEMNEVQKNLADLDLDGDVDTTDAQLILTLWGMFTAGVEPIAAEEGVYYYSMDTESPAYITNMTYSRGDIDMDGFYTRHDAAMLSRYLIDDTYALTEKQLSLADMNSDGEITQADADMIYGNAMFNQSHISDASDSEELDIDDAFKVLEYYAHTGAGLSYIAMDDKQKSLADMDLDGDVDVTDATLILTLYARAGAGLPDTNAENGIGYYSLDPESPAYIG